ncbi:MAG: PfkB family carbohydrate kinase [Bacteroidota bacterium]
MLGYFLGLTTIDIQYLVNNFPKENAKQKSTNFCINIGGPALNAAATFVRLGGKAKFFTAIGTHALSQYIFSELENLGIEYVDLAPQELELPVIATVISNSKNGNRSIMRNQGRKALIDSTILEKSMKEVPQISLLDGFHMEVAATFAAYAGKHKSPIIMDGGSWKERSLELISLSDIAICSDDFRVPSDTVMQYLADKGVKLRAISRGSSPILFEEGNERGEISVPQVQAIDSLGAGDVLHGAFAYFFAKGHSFSSALKEAAEIASESTTYFGSRPNH